MAVADPTFTPATGTKLLAGHMSTIQLGTVTTSSVLWITSDLDAPVGTTPPWAITAGALTPTLSAGEVVRYQAYAAKAGVTNSGTVTSSYGGIGFSSAVDADTLAVVDFGAINLNGSVSQGIGQTGADGTTMTTTQIGGATGVNIKFENGIALP